MERRRFRIGTFNVHNLAMPGTSVYGRKYTDKEFGQKIEWIAGQLSKMKPDLVGFQEVFEEEALRKALAASPATKDFKHVVMGEPSGNDKPKVALASRFPLEAPFSHDTFQKSGTFSMEGKDVPVSEFSRPVLQAEVAFPAKQGTVKLKVFVVHLKSKRPKVSPGESETDVMAIARGQARSLVIRAAETVALRDILVKILHGDGKPAPLVVLGDINDSGDSVTSEIFSGTPPYRRWKEQDRQSSWETLLRNVKDIQSRVSYEDHYYTHIFNGRFHALDHIYISDILQKGNKDCIGYVEYVKVFNDHLVDETLSPAGKEFAESDHGQVVCTLCFPDKTTQ